MDSCRASCSMPLAAPVVELDSIPYVDGSVSNSIPIEYAQEKSNKVVVLVLTQKAGYIKKDSDKLTKTLISIKYKKYPKIINSLLDRSQRYNEKIAIIDELEKKGEIFIIRPEVDTISHLEENIDILNDFYLHGFSLMEKRFTEFQNYVKKQSQ